MAKSPGFGLWKKHTGCSHHRWSLGILCILQRKNYTNIHCRAIRTEYTKVDAEKTNLHNISPWFFWTKMIFSARRAERKKHFFLPTRERKDTKNKRTGVHAFHRWPEEFLRCLIPTIVKQYLYAKSNPFMKNVTLCQTGPWYPNIFGDAFIQFIFFIAGLEKAICTQSIKWEREKTASIQAEDWRRRVHRKTILRTTEKNLWKAWKRYAGLSYLRKNNISAVPDPIVKDEIKRLRSLCIHRRRWNRTYIAERHWSAEPFVHELIVHFAKKNHCSNLPTDHAFACTT